MTAPTISPRLLNTAEAAAWLGIHKQWLEHARIEQRGPNVTRIGRVCRYRMSDLESFAAANVEVKSNKFAM